jgi:hypothetical protein
MGAGMKRTTIKDVAREAGVSITIASFALNNVKGRVSRDVKKKVLECADRLGYIPNAFAQNLRTRNSNTIGLIYDEAYMEERNSSTLQLVSSAIKYAGEKGKDILVKLIDTDGDMEKQFPEFIELWESRRVNGLIFQCSKLEPVLLEEMKKRNSKNGKSNSKQVEIFDKNGVSLDIFESATELERQSEELFGVKLLQSAISSVCKGKYPKYKGYTFKYI